jgi:predicted nucleic acid-binding protein
LARAIRHRRRRSPRACIAGCSSCAPRALELALGRDHPVYGCFYLALAEMERAELVTADLRPEGRLRNTL